MDGKALAERVRAEVAKEVEELGPLGLATILVGDDPASDVYVTLKHKDATEVGMRPVDKRLPADTSEADVLALVEELNADEEVDGLLVQTPVPEHLDEFKILSSVLPMKDVDGLAPRNAGLLYLGRNGHVGATPLGVMRLLAEYRVPTAGARAVVVGRSPIVGKPMAMLLLQANATVTVCHSRTDDLARHTRDADILVAAVRQPGVDHRRDGEGRRDGDRRRDHAHGSGSRRRRGPGCRGARRVPHARPGRGRTDDPGHAPGEHREGRQVPPWPLAVSLSSAIVRRLSKGRRLGARAVACL